MKNKLIKTFLVATLSLACVFFAVACGTNDPVEPSPTSSFDSPRLTTSGVDVGYEYVVRLDSIEGSCTKATHERWIDVIDFSCGTQNEITDPSTGLTTTFLPVVFTHKVDKSTPNLQKYCMSGTRISTGEFNAMKSVAGRTSVTHKIKFETIQIVDSVVKSVTDENGSSYLLEEVTMLVGSQTVEESENARISTNGGLEYFVELDGVTGSCTNSAFNRWIDVVEFSHGAAQTNQTVAPDFTEKGTFEPVTFTHLADTASVKIQENCKKGAKITSAEFDATKSVAGKQTVVYKVAFEGVRIQKAEIKTVKDESGKSYLVEEVTFTADKEKWTNVAMGIDGSTSGSTEAEYDQTKRA